MPEMEISSARVNCVHAAPVAVALVVCWSRTSALNIRSMTTFVPARTARTEDGDDILSGVLPESTSIFVLDVDNVKYKGALCRQNDMPVRDGRVAVTLLIEQKSIRVPIHAILKGMARNVQLALAINVLMPLLMAQCSSHIALVELDFDKTSFDAHMTTLIDTILRDNSNVSANYKQTMQEALEKLPHRLKTDLFVVCASIANNDLFARLHAKADLAIESFKVLAPFIV
jgi:hypothetical protein